MTDLFATLIALIFNIVCGYFIAKYIGAKKRIGHFNSFQWSVSFGAIFGLIISLISKKEGVPYKTNNFRIRTFFAYLSFIGAIFQIINCIYYSFIYDGPIPNSYKSLGIIGEQMFKDGKSFTATTLFVIGSFTLGVYLLATSKIIKEKNNNELS
jgi:hypothetical protein